MLVLVNNTALETLQSDPVLCTLRIELPCVVWGMPASFVIPYVNTEKK